MGLSIRTSRYRFTRWYLWDGTLLQPKFTEEGAGDELYDHRGDDGLDLNLGYEATNLAALNPLVVRAMVARLEAAFRPTDLPTQILSDSNTTAIVGKYESTQG